MAAFRNVRLAPRLTAIPAALSQFSGIMSFINADDATKADMMVEGAKIEFTTRKTLAIPTPKGTQEYSFTPSSFEQYAKLLGIPHKYLVGCPISGKGSMKDQIEVQMEKRLGLEHLIRVRKQEPEEGISGLIRAVLPGDYTPFDNRHMLTAVQRAIGTSKEFEIKSHNAADPRAIEDSLEIRIVHRSQFDPGMYSDPHQIGFHGKTSETGKHDVRVDALVYRLVCKNGMMGWGDAEVLHERHRNFTVPEMTPRIVEAIHASLRQKDAVADLLSRSMGEPITDAEKEINAIATRMRATDALRERVLETFKLESRGAEGGITRFHVAQAFTRAAQELPLQDRLDLETRVGRVMFGGQAIRRRRGEGGGEE